MQPSDAISQLLEAGLTEAAIGDRVGVNQSTINRIRRGQIPTWPIGQALVKAAEEERKKASPRAPKKRAA